MTTRQFCQGKQIVPDKAIRYDIMLIPRDRSKRGIIIEFKKVSKVAPETLEAAAANARGAGCLGYRTPARPMGFADQHRENRNRRAQ